MSEKYIRVSAQNLNYSVYDTNDLATIKGGSSALINGVIELQTHLKKYAFKPFFVAASELFGTLKTTINNEVIEQDCQKFLQEKVNGFQYAVSIYECDAIKALTEGERLNREKQYKTLSFTLPKKGKFNTYCDLDGVYCDLDGVRPATIKQHDIHFSDFTHQRRKAERETQKGKHFAKSFHDLLSHEKLSPALSNKIALIYMDGNNFGDARKEANNKGKLSEFSKTIKEIQKAIENALIDHMEKCPKYNPLIDPNKEINKYRNCNAETIRFQTLLYGGDEMMFAVPAYEAWNLVHVILNKLKDVQYTYSIGVAFAHVKTPIRALTQLVDEICEEAKSTSKTKNCVSLFACESVDIPLGGLSKVREKLFGLSENTKYAFTDFEAATEWMQNVIKEIPKSQAMKMVRDMKDYTDKDKWFTHLTTEFKRIYGENAETKIAFLKEQPCLPIDSCYKLPLLTALLLWDYAEVAHAKKI